MSERYFAAKSKDMNTRRKFLRQTLLGSLAVGNAGRLFDQLDINAPNVKNAFPVVISTWGPNIKANAAAWQVLSSGGYALDAIETGIHVPEANPEDTSVGYGGYPDRDGHVTLDACIMNEKGMAGCVTFLEHIMHPISVARKVMENTPHVIMSGDGALQFALDQGFKKENLLTKEAKKAWDLWKIEAKYEPVINVERHDTIGMLAMDMQQRLCGGCSTSGLAFKMHGRVGDSPVIGAGLFVDNEVGAAVCTGLGEMVLRTVGSFLVVEEMRRGKSPQKAVEIAIKRIVKKYPEQSKDAQVAFIALDRKGRHGAYSIHPGFNYVLYQDGENRIIESTSLLEK